MLQKAMRELVDEEVREDAQAREKDGKRPSIELVRKFGELNLNAMVRRRLRTFAGGPCAIAPALLPGRELLTLFRFLRRGWARASSSTVASSLVASSPRNLTTSTSASSRDCEGRWSR